MKVSNCLFCNIVAGKIPSSKFWENRGFIAILDIFPNTKGVSLVVSKEHYPSDIFINDTVLIHKLLDSSKIVASKLMKVLKPSRVALVVEGVYSDHLHIKLYPLYKTEVHRGTLAPKKSYFKNYPGYVTTITGPEWSREKLNKLAAKIKQG